MKELVLLVLVAVLLSFHLLPVQGQLLEVSTFVGTCGSQFSEFSQPQAIVFNTTANAYFVADSNSGFVKKVDMNGAVSTFASGLNSPTGLAINPTSGALIVADSGNHCLKELKPNTVTLAIAGTCTSSGMTDAQATYAKFNYPRGIAFNDSSVLFITDERNHCIRILSGDHVSSWVGQCGVSGTLNGRGTAAKFNLPFAITIGSPGVYTVSDRGNNCLRKIFGDRDVTTLAGTCGSAGSTLNGPTFAVQLGDLLFMSDTGNNCIKVITSAGIASLFAGSCNSTVNGTVDGSVKSARFNGPLGIAAYNGGETLMITDSSNNCIRKIKGCPVNGSYDVATQNCFCDPGFELLGSSCSFCRVPYFKKYTGAYPCSMCDVGYTSLSNRISCKACGAGTYRSSLVQTCTACPNNSTCTTTGFTCDSGFILSASKLSCEKCPAGQVPNFNGTSCSPCPSNTYRTTELLNCTSCPENSNCTSTGFICNDGYKLNATATGCDQCPIGQESDSSMSHCAVCLPGKYRPSLESAKCIDCPSNATCNPFNFSCNAGFSYDSLSKSCVPCPIGYFKEVIGNQSCQSCPLGYESNADKTLCVECESGFHRPDLSYSACIACPANLTCSTAGLSCKAGFTLDSVSQKCVQCPLGQYKSVSGNQTCNFCPIGEESNNDRTTCKPCIAGSTYRSMNTTETCQTCPDNAVCFTTEYVCDEGFMTNSANTGCEDCPVGYQSNSDRLTCTKCPQGKYRPSLAYRSCISCPDHSFCNETTFSCNPGYYMDPATESCLLCADGSFKSTTGNETCSLCALGMESNSLYISCQICADGTYRDSVAKTTCVICPDNSNCTTTGFSCLLGFKKEGEVCSNCPVGTQSNEERTECVACPRGKYRDSLNIAVCLDCPQNAACNSDGFICESGYSFNSITKSCDKCPLGFYKSDPGNYECAMCDKGSVSNNNGTECIMCPFDTYRPSLDILSCIACPENSDCQGSSFTCKEGFQFNETVSGCVSLFESSERRNVFNNCADDEFFKRSIGSCVQCPVNSLCYGFSYACYAGFYQNPDFDECVKCQVGFYKDKIGNATCQQCPIGTEPSIGRNECVECSIGKIKPSQKFLTCVQCPVNSETCNAVEFSCKQGTVKKADEVICESKLVQQDISNDATSIPFIYQLIAAVSIILILLAAIVILQRRSARQLDKYRQTIYDLSTEALTLRQSNMKLDPTYYDKQMDMQTITLDATQSHVAPQTTSTEEMSLAQQGLAIPGFMMYVNGKDFNIGKFISKGGNGMVHLGSGIHESLMKHGETIIVKQMIKVKSAPERDSFLQEVAVMFMLKEHKNIAKLIGFSTDPYCILMKYYELGSLHRWMNSSANLKSKSILLGFLSDICHALQYMHQHGLAHCDLKLSNVLLDTNGHGDITCALSDFGLTTIVKREVLKVQAFKVIDLNGISIGYASPETLIRFRKGSIWTPTYDAQKADIYSLAINMFGLLCRKSAWSKSAKEPDMIFM